MKLLHKSVVEYLQSAQRKSGWHKTQEEINSAALSLIAYGALNNNHDMIVQGAALDWASGYDKYLDEDGETINPCIEDIETATNFFNHFVKDGKFDEEAFEKELAEGTEAPF